MPGGKIYGFVEIFDGFDVATSSLYVSNSNSFVGVGTNTPSGKFEISDTNANYIFTSNSTSGYTTTINMDDTGLDIGHGSSSRALNLKTGGSDRITVLGNGNVGINQTSPDTSLHISKSSIQTPSLPTGNVATFEYSTSFTMEASIAILGGTNGKSEVLLGDSSTSDIVSLSKRNDKSFSIDMKTGFFSGTAFVIDDNGNVGVGITASTPTVPAKFSVVEGNGTDPSYNSKPIAIFKNNSVSNDEANISIISSSASTINFGDSAREKSGVISYNHNIDEMDFIVDGGTKMVIESNGEVGIGTTSPEFLIDVRRQTSNTSSYVSQFRNTFTGEFPGGEGVRVTRFQIDNTSGSGNEYRFCEFTRSVESTIIGWINVASSSSVAYNTTSDARVKENIVDASNEAVNKIMNTRVVEYNRKGESGKEIGLLAQEFYNIYPSSVSKGDNGIDELDDKNSGVWGIDYSKLVPLLIKTVQSQQEEIEKLKSSNKS